MTRRRVVGIALGTLALGAVTLPATASAGVAYPPPCPPHSIIEPGGVAVWVGCTRVIFVPTS